MNTVRFMGEVCTLEWGWYANPPNRRLQLWASDGPMATASINPDVQLGEGLIAIKDYRENQGVLSALTNAGIVAETGQFVPAGYETVPVCRILLNE